MSHSSHPAFGTALTFLMLWVYAQTSAGAQRPQRFDVTRAPYSADKTGKSDASGPIQRAINDAIRAGSGNTVYVPAGTYLLGTALDISHADRLTFTGASDTATKFLTTPTQGCVLGVYSSASPVMENFCNDGQVLNFTQGTVTAFSGNTLTFQIEAGYPSLTASNLTLAAKADTLYSFSDPRRGYDGSHPKIQAEADAGDGRWSLTLDTLPGGVYIGERVAIWNRNNIPGGICYNVGYCDSPTVRNVTDYCGGWNSLGAIYGDTGPITVTNFNACPPPGSDRLITSGGGTIGGNRGDLTFTGCTWRQIDDDCLDYGNGFHHILAQPAPNQITVADNGCQVGDTVQVWGYAVGNPSIRDTARITGVGTAAGGSLLTLDHAVTVLKPDPDNSGGGWDGYDRMQDTSECGSLLIRGCKVQSDRARCLLLHASGSIRVQGCTIYNGRMEAVFLGLEQETDEGTAPTSIAVMDNMFTGNDGACVFVGDDNGYQIGKESNTLFPSVTISGNRFRNNEQPNLNIGTNPSIYDWPTAVLLTCAKKATVTGNRFWNNTGANVAIQCCSNVTVSGNEFLRPNAAEPWPESLSVDAVISADNVQGLTLAGNVVSRPGPYTKTLLATTPTVTGVSGAANGLRLVRAARVSDEGGASPTPGR